VILHYADGDLDTKTRCGLLIFVSEKIKRANVRSDWAFVDCRNCRRRLVEKGLELYERLYWSEECSGCTERCEGQLVSGPHGCHECGYTGRSRRFFLAPVNRAAQIAMGLP
jgi:hypothetical protein